MIDRISSFFGRFPKPGIYFVFPGKGGEDKSKKNPKTKKKPTPKPVDIKDQPAILLDTSALIDARIADIAETGFLAGTFIVPDFVMEELQQVADSKDKLKRNRGRRGLDVLQALKKNKFTKFKVYQDDDLPKGDVDKKLLRVAKKLKGRVITTDYNLNKVGKVSGVPILNVNELANMVKTVVLPGEEFEICLLKEGKEKKQAIGYLPDGTMVVVEDAKDLVGEEVPVIVERLWQTDAGRMVFAKIQR